MTRRNFHLPGRSPVYAREGMAATSHPLASIAAVDVLKAGGTAADAAVAAVATLCVVEPAMTGIGGDCFCLVAKPNAPLWGYNGSGRAASAATTERMLAAGLPRKIPATSPHAVTVPGAIEAWEAILKAHGRFDLDKVLQHAIRYAENGFPIAPRVAADWATMVDKLTPHAGSVKHFLVNGKSPGVGHVMRLPALAATLKAIAAGGAKAFYEGAIAADIAATVQAAGGLLAAEDLARHKGDVVEPICDELSRARCRRTAAEWAGADRAGAAEHPRAVRSEESRSDGRGAAASRARSRAACVRRTRYAPRGSCLHA